jgi:oxygen-dependent protoporphyrinogen oxidase
MNRIAVVGAGISGLATAWYLSRSGHRVEVFEAQDRIGGVIDTIAVGIGSDSFADPLLIECGADNFATLMPDAWDLVRQMGLESEFITPKKDYRIAQVVCRGRLYPIPNGFSLMQPTRMGSILATPILSLAGKLRVLREAFVPPRPDGQDESVESFAIRRLGRECFERLVEPIVGGIFTAQADKLSMQAAMPQFLRMEREHGSLIRAAFAKRRQQTAETRSAREASGARYDQFTAPKLGMKWWLDKLAEPLGKSLHLSHRVETLERSQESGWNLKVVSPLDQSPRIERFDRVCLALPSYAAGALLKDIDASLASGLESIPYASSAIAVLALKRDEIRPEALCFGSIAPTIEKRNCLAVSLSSEKYAGRCPDDTVIMRAFMGGAVRPELLEHSDEHLLDLAFAEVKALFGVKTKPSYQRLVRWNRAMPQYHVGHVQRVASIRELMARYPGLALAGNAYDGVGIPQCIRSAKQAASMLGTKLPSVS